MTVNRRQALALAASLPLASRSWAQDASYPSKPVTLVLPFPAGGQTDAVARTLARGLEAALAEELNEIAQGHSPTLKVHTQVPGGVHCSGTMADAMRVNLHSRIASRVLMRIAHASYLNENDVYDLALAQPWEDWFEVHHTIRIDVTAIKSPLKSLEFTTLKI